MSPATTTFGRAGAGNVHIESDRQSASEVSGVLAVVLRAKKGAKEIYV